CDGCVLQCMSRACPAPRQARAFKVTEYPVDFMVRENALNDGEPVCFKSVSWHWVLSLQQSPDETKPCLSTQKRSCACPLDRVQAATGYQESFNATPDHFTCRGAPHQTEADSHCCRRYRIRASRAGSSQPDSRPEPDPSGDTKGY